MVHFVVVVFWTAVGGVFYTYCGYPLLLGLCHFLVRRHASRYDDDFVPSVSLVLAAFNEASYMRAKLDNCLALDYPRDRLEILVGSDGSTDGTNEIAEGFTGYGVRVYNFKPRRGKMAAVNRLVREASGEVCVFSDISELFDEDALRKLVRHFSDPQVGAVTGNHIYNPKGTGLGAGTLFYWKFQRLLQSVESRLSTICQCDGTIYACRRRLFPFPPDETINDDVAVPLGVICQGNRVVFEPGAVARGDILPTTRNFFRQKIRGQAGRYQNFHQFPSMFLPWPPLRWWIFVSHLVLPVLVPWMLLVCLGANLALALSNAPIYQLLLICQLVFYLVAFIGWCAERSRLYVPLLALPFYFVTANAGSLFGFFSYVNGLQSAAWRKVD